MSNLIDFVPFLQRFNTKLKIRADKLHQDLVQTYGGLIKDIESKLASGVPVDDCLAKDMIEMQEYEELDDLDMAILASAFMIGGVETVRSLLQTSTY